MGSTVTQAQQDLRALLGRGDATSLFRPQGSLAGTPLRHSSVLMLFGALDHTPAASPVDTVPAALDVLLTRRSPTMRHHPGQIAFPGGGAEAMDAHPAATALREAAEETGLDPTGVEVLGELPQAHVYVSNNLVTPVVGWWSLPSEIAADTTEAVEVFRAPVAELLDPAARGTSVIARSGSTFRGPAFRLAPRFGGHIVWGLTGMLLASLFDDLGWSVPWDAAHEFTVLP